MKKICSMCKVEKDITEFRKSGKYYRSECKECSKILFKDWYERTKVDRKEHVSRVHKEHYNKNKERILAYQKKYRENNKDKIKAYKKVYYQNNKEYIEYYQAKGRLNRVGQTKKPLYYMLVSKGKYSVDSLNYDALMNKKDFNDEWFAENFVEVVNE